MSRAPPPAERVRAAAGVPGSLPGLAIGLLLLPSPALAHASERGHLLLLPTGHYLIGGALAVAMTFAALLFVPSGALGRLGRVRLILPAPGRPAVRPAASALSALLLLGLVAAGFWGSPDPLANPLPLTVWTLFWVGVTLFQAAIGDAWAWLNPWKTPYAAARQLGWRPPFALPGGLSAWPALALFLGFAWFELVYPAPDDPPRLALAVGAYWLFTSVATLLFGFDAWSRSGEFFSVLFGLLGRLAPIRGERGRPTLRLPGARLGRDGPLPASATLLLVAALAAVSFDGLSQTFWYLSLWGVNPLEHPGRSALIVPNTIGLVLTIAVMAAAFLGSVALGRALAGLEKSSAAGLTVWSLVPIALAYHFAHYAAAFLVDAQYWLRSLSDPFGLGWNLLGTADMPVRAAVTAGSRAAKIVWNAQAAAIVGGHLLAVLVAHGLALRLCRRRRQVALFLLPLSTLMVLYTLLGLWLLSTPSAG